MTNEEQAALLATLVDERTITALATRYCTALDSKQWSDLSSVFTPDASANLGHRVAIVGLPALMKEIEGALIHLDESQHLIGNHHVTVHGDTATHHCYFQAQHVRKSAAAGPLYTVAGRYEDDLVRTPDGWRIHYRNLVVTWSQGNPAVPRPDGRAQPTPSNTATDQETEQAFTNVSPK